MNNNPKIIELPSILPGALDLADINQKIRKHQVQLDWSGVVSASESQLEILLEQIDLDNYADWLGINGEIADSIATDILQYFEKQKIRNNKKSRTKKKQVTKATPEVWEQGKLLETQFIPSQDNQISGQANLLEAQFVPANNLVISEETTKPEEENIKPLLAATIPTADKIRQELEKAVIADLRGPAGGEDEELDEDSVSDRYLVGLLAPQYRRMGGQKIEKSIPVNEPANDINDDSTDDSREVDYSQLETFDELAIAGKGTAEEGTTEVNVPPAETMFPSSLGMTFCVSSTAKALQITAGWGQYKRIHSSTLTKRDGAPKLRVRASNFVTDNTEYFHKIG